MDSPKDLTISGDSIRTVMAGPLLIVFGLEMSLNKPAAVDGTLATLRAFPACSLEESVPKP